MFHIIMTKFHRLKINAKTRRREDYFLNISAAGLKKNLKLKSYLFYTKHFASSRLRVEKRMLGQP